MFVDCGKCLVCHMKYSAVWAQRLMHEKKFHEKAVFATLTYNDVSLPPKWDGRLLSGYASSAIDAHKNHDRKKCAGLCKVDIQNFLKRLRKKVKVRFYLAGEYGERTARAHYHAIIFGLGDNLQDSKVLQDAWSLDGKVLGHIDVKKVEYASCAYVARYVVKKQVGRKSKEEYACRGVIPEFSLMSRRPGIGAQHVEKYKNEILNRGFMVVCGHKAAVPKYYVSKVYDTPEKLEIRKKQVEKFQMKILKDNVDRLKDSGYNWFSQVEKADAEGTKNRVLGMLKMKKKVL